MPPLLKVGERVPSFVAEDLDGRTIRIGYEGATSTILYVFSPDCPWCVSNATTINAIAAQLGSSYRMYGLALKDEALAEHVTSSGYKFPIIHRLGNDVREAYALGATPETIVVGRDGRVLRTWLGAFTKAEHRADAEMLLGVRLPSADQKN